MAIAHRSRVILLLLAVPPDILDYPTSNDMVVKEGSNVTLKCEATGSPEPTIIFRREDGEPILLPGNIEGKWNYKLYYSYYQMQLIVIQKKIRRT